MSDSDVSWQQRVVRRLGGNMMFPGKGIGPWRARVETLAAKGERLNASEEEELANLLALPALVWRDSETLAGGARASQPLPQLARQILDIVCENVKR